MSAREIQYLNRDFCTLFSKPLVYLHYVTYMNKYPNASYQYVLKMEPFNDKTTEELIISKFKEHVQSVLSVSRLCRLLVFIHEFQIEYSNIIDDIETYPSFTYNVYNISNNIDSIPDNSIVWEINKISPRICGIFFENIIQSFWEIHGGQCTAILCR